MGHWRTNITKPVALRFGAQIMKSRTGKLRYMPVLGRDDVSSPAEFQYFLLHGGI